MRTEDICTELKKVYVVAYMDGDTTGWVYADNMTDANILFEKTKRRMEKAKKWIVKVPRDLNAPNTAEFVERNYHDEIFGKWDRLIAIRNGYSCVSQS